MSVSLSGRIQHAGRAGDPQPIRFERTRGTVCVPYLRLSVFGKQAGGLSLKSHPHPLSLLGAFTRPQSRRLATLGGKQNLSQNQSPRPPRQPHRVSYGYAESVNAGHDQRTE